MKKSSYDYFDVEYTKKSLKYRAVRGGGIIVLTRIISTLIQMGGVVALARLLIPSDFGLFTMASVIINFFFVFQELGLADATIQAPQINHDQVSTLFWINVAFGAAMTVVLIAISPAAAWFYKRSELTLVIIVSSISFLFYGFTAQHQALLKRNMMFVRYSVSDLLSQLISTMGAVALALLGFRYWAIVARPIFYSLSNWVCTWIFCRWRPGLPKKGSGVRPLLNFGANSVVFYIVNYFINNLDKSLIGRKYGAEQVGYYGRAYYLSAYPASQLSTPLFHVAVSTLSKLRQDAGKYRRYYLSAISVMSFLGMPASVFMAMMSKELVYILLGPQWSQTAELFAILSLGIGMNILSASSGWLFVSLGRTDRWRNWGLLSSGIMVVGYFVGISFGVKGVAIAYMVLTFSLTFPGILYGGRPIGIRFREIYSTIWKYILASVLAGAILFHLKSLAILENMIVLKTILSLVFYLCVYLALVVLFYRGIAPIREIVSLFKIMVGKRHQEEIN